VFGGGDTLISLYVAMLWFCHMEPENLNRETSRVDVKTEVTSPLYKVTPLSKYLAMILFIALPFIGGWIGYEYATEKVIEVERVISENLDSEVLDIVYPLETERVTHKDGRNAPDGRMLSDEDMYEATGLPYITTFSKEYPLYVLGGAYSSTVTIYKYDEITQKYQPLIENILDVAQKNDIEIYNKGGLVLWGWSKDLRYLGIHLTGYEGIFPSLVYYIDIQNLSKGLISGSSDFLSSSVKTFISPDRSKILGMNNSSEIVIDTKNNLSIFDLNTQTTKIIYSHSEEESTFQTPEFYDGSSYANAKWLDENTVEIKISTNDNYEMYYNDPNEGRGKFEEGLETIIVNVE